MKALPLLIPLLLSLGCAGGTSSSAATAGQTQADTSREPWFCQAGATDDDWACVQSEALAAAPKPSRLPARRETTPAVIDVPARRQSRATPAPAAPPVAATPPARAAPAAQPPQPAPAAANVPKYVELSYRPDKPMSILDLPKDFWAVQIVALSSKEALEQYAEENNIRGMSAARIWNGQQLFYILLLGIYETRENAEAAIASLGPPFDTRKPWIRSVGSLQSAMLEANREAGTAEI